MEVRRAAVLTYPLRRPSDGELKWRVGIIDSQQPLLSYHAVLSEKLANLRTKGLGLYLVLYPNLLQVRGDGSRRPCATS